MAAKGSQGVMIFPHISLSLSGDRFTVLYRLKAADEAEARARARGICLEQTVEVPETLLADDDIRAQVVGRIESLRGAGPGYFETVISYAVESSGLELIQLLNVIFGNTSMQAGIRVLELELPDNLLKVFKGPRWGREGLRERLRVAPGRPLLATALKPMGLPASELARLARQFALGGIDIIKDDHGLADQAFAPYRERVRRCAEAINEANQQTGYHCIYVPNVTAGSEQALERAHFAREAGAGGLMVAPGLAGWSTLHRLAADDTLALPVFSHPALLGSFVTGEGGMAHRVVFGQLPRLAGADATIYVNYGGRFSFSREACQEIVEATGRSMGRLRPMFPMPGGGMTLARLPEMAEFHGREIIFLVAGGLYGHGPDILESCRQFRRVVDELAGSRP